MEAASFSSTRKARATKAPAVARRRAAAKAAPEAMVNCFALCSSMITIPEGAGPSPGGYGSWPPLRQPQVLRALQGVDQTPAVSH